MGTNRFPQLRPADSENESKILKIGAYALAPTLFQDQRFKALYDREYQKIEDWNSFVEKFNPLVLNTRNQISNVLKGILNLDGKGVDLESFDEASLNDKENLGSLVLKVLESSPQLYSEYEPLIVAAGRDFIVKKNNRPTRPLLSE